MTAMNNTREPPINQKRPGALAHDKCPADRGCNGSRAAPHPAGGPPVGPADLPVFPYASLPSAAPTVTVPRLNGRSDAPPVASGTSGLMP